MKKFIPVNQPLLKGNEKKYLINAINTNWISSEGPYIKKFENLLQKTVSFR
jgi:perosamine synthetase